MIDTIGTICKEIAPTLNRDEKLIRKVYAHYWKHVKHSVASGNYTSIWLRSIGTLAVSRTKVQKIILKLIRRLRWLDKQEELSTRKTKAQRQQETLDDLRLMCARRNEIAIIYKTNQERYDAKVAGRLGKQTPDINGADQ